jgi:RloB-like protein
MSNKAQRPGKTGFSRETDLLRRANTRPERRSVLVVTNGARTEFDYFDSLRREQWVTADKVTVKFESGEPIAVVLRAGKIREDNAYDEAWAVCDVDEFATEAAIAAAAEREVELALSRPCFEIWLILHVSEGCPRFNSAAQVGRHLKSLLPNWEKTGLKFSDFSSGVFDAVERAKRLGEPPDANPSTALWRLIESLRNPPPSI